jgi:hypothetical protein
MDGTTTLIRQLDQLMADLGEPGVDLSSPLDDLVRSLQIAIPSYCGLVVHVRRHGHPITLTALTRQGGMTAAASLRWTTAHRSPHEETSLTLYAQHAGAFVDLATDLGYLLHGPPRLHDERRSEDLVRLDRDLPPPTQSSSITGVDELSVINRAAGVLIDRGTPPQQAMLELTRHASAAGLAPYTYARTLLDHLVDPPGTSPDGDAGPPAGQDSP